MKKIIILSLCLVLAVSVFAVVKQQQKIGKGEVELVFENIVIDDLEFIKGNEIKIKSKEDDVVMEKDNQKIFISADKKSKVSIKLPSQNLYLINLKDGGHCYFDFESVRVLGKDGEKINFSSDGLEVNDDGEHVKISSKGIFVENDKEQVSITSEGIIVKNDDEDVYLTGFWGSLLGSAIQGVSGAAISWVGNNPEKIVKSIVNDRYDDDDKPFGLNWSITKSDSSEKVYREFTGIFKTGKNKKVNVSNRNGNVDIVEWDKDYVDIYAKISISDNVKDTNAELQKVKIEILEKDGCTINTNFLKKNAKISVSYEIKVPRNNLLGDISTSNGDIDIENVDGGNLTSSNGNIIILSCRGDVDATTSNGLIKAVNLAGNLYASTSNGKIYAKNVENIKMLNTSNASIFAEIINLHNDTSISTSNGNIKIEIAGDIECELEASTSNGYIKSDDINIDFNNKSKTYIKGEIGKGGKLLRISGSNGNINLNKI